MTDGLDKDELGQPGAGAASADAPVVIDSIEAAFAALEAEAVSADASNEGRSPTGAPAEVGTDGSPASAAGSPAQGEDAGLAPGDAGGSLPAGAGDGEPADDGASFDVEEAVETYTKQIEENVLLEVAQMFGERADEDGNKLIRQTDGRLGATINDADIYKVDERTGAPAFFNPDTGLPFTGDNPRAQAKQWVADYNEELRDTFNRIAEERSQVLLAEAAPVIQLLEFSPTYDKLDPVRQQMFEAIVEDYEIEDENGDVIGYSIDLNKALAQVNRQVSSLKASSTPPAPPAPPTGPALDMPNAGGDGGKRPEFKNVAEAMEWEQDQQLAKLRAGKK